MTDTQTLLYVDDNPKTRRLLTAILEQHGFTVIAAGDSLDEIRQGDDSRFDLVLLDYETPLISGADLAREIKCKYPEIPLVMVSGRAPAPDEGCSFVDAHLGPGTALDDLVTTMRMLIVGSFLTHREPSVRTNWADST
jgi:CheY-like chemotaxis protein